MHVTADPVAQHRYAQAARRRGMPATLVRPAGVRGLIDLGFRDTVAALCALIDNALDARARHVGVLVETTAGRVAALAIIDDGVGMVPEMIRAACAASTSCRLGDGPHFARSGFGLPCAPLSIGDRFTLLSKPMGGQMHGVVLDKETVAQIGATIPEASPMSPPPFVAARLAQTDVFKRSTTIVVIDQLDRLVPPQPVNLRGALRSRLGSTFQALSSRLSLRLDGKALAFVDPLFLTPNTFGFDIDADRAVAGPSFQLTHGEGRVSMRSAMLPPAFCSMQKTRAPAGRNANIREPVLRAHQGLLVSRMGRRIAQLDSAPFWRLSGGDEAWRIELDFTPELDRDFAPALNLESVKLSTAMWTRLRDAGLSQAIDTLRRQSRHAPPFND